MYFLGVDGGGTKTCAAVADGYGRVLGIGFGGPSNPGWAPEGAVKESVLQAVKAALGEAGLAAAGIAYSYLGMGGVGDLEHAGPLFEGIMRELGFRPDAFYVDNDAYVGMASAIGIGPGVCLVSGTGFTAVAVTPQGERLRIPRQFLKHGPGWAIGKEAAMIALLDAWGVGPRTAITERILSKLGLSDGDELLDWLGRGAPNWQLGELAAEVSRCADRSDPVAVELLKATGRELGIAAALMARKASLDRERCRIALIGGVFKAGDHVMRPPEEVLRASGVQAELVRPSAPPVAGALLLACHRAGKPLSAAQADALKEGLASRLAR